MTLIETDLKPIELELNVNDYEPIIPENVSDLKQIVASYKKSFPKTFEVFSSILDQHYQKHLLLEDWLIILPYQFFYSRDWRKPLQWFEVLYTEAEKRFGRKIFLAWLEEFLIQTNCISTHALCNRFYDYQLQLYGGLHLSREGFSVEFIPRDNNRSTPDWKAYKRNSIHILNLS